MLVEKLLYCRYKIFVFIFDISRMISNYIGIFNLIKLVYLVIKKVRCIFYG